MKYGIVKIVKGEYKGRFGLYDDYEETASGKEKPIVYIGDMFFGAPYVILRDGDITDDYTNEDVEKRMREIITELVNTNDDSVKVSLFQEYILIQNACKGIYEFSNQK